MRNFHIKSIVLGMGIGIVLTSIVSMIYTAGLGSGVKMSREEIIAQARQYGMVEGSGFVGDSTPKAETGNDSGKLEGNKNEDGTPIGTTPSVTTPAPKTSTQEQEIKVAINRGDTSETVAERLVKAGLISDKDAFKKKLTDMGLASEIEIGEFKIKKGSSQETIIRIITGQQ